MADLMEFIKTEWSDIHHTRNQDWKVLVIILGIFYALFEVSPFHFWLNVAITVLGLIASGMGIYMNFCHWIIFYNKIRIITACEEKLGIKLKIFKYFFPVQGLIMLIYFFIFSILAGWLMWLLVGKIFVSFITFIICFLIGFIICIIARNWIEKTVEKKTSITFDF